MTSTVSWQTYLECEGLAANNPEDGRVNGGLAAVPGQVVEEGPAEGVPEVILLLEVGNREDSLVLPEVQAEVGQRQVEFGKLGVFPFLGGLYKSSSNESELRDRRETVFSHLDQGDNRLETTAVVRELDSLVLGLILGSETHGTSANIHSLDVT